MGVCSSSDNQIIAASHTSANYVPRIVVSNDVFSPGKKVPPSLGS
jgi:hypothetical protein